MLVTFDRRFRTEGRHVSLRPRCRNLGARQRIPLALAGWTVYLMWLGFTPTGRWRAARRGRIRAYGGPRLSPCPRAGRSRCPAVCPAPSGRLRGVASGPRGIGGSFRRSSKWPDRSRARTRRRNWRGKCRGPGRSRRRCGRWSGGGPGFRAPPGTGWRNGGGRSGRRPGGRGAGLRGSDWGRHFRFSAAISSWSAGSGMGVGSMSRPWAARASR